MRVTNDARTQVLAAYTYGIGNERLASSDGSSTRTLYVWGGSGVIAEYTDTGTLSWQKSYIYFGGRLLSTISPTGATERVEFHHPDRLGTRLITAAGTIDTVEQETLPFGTQLSSQASGTRRFTSYERNFASGLDYAVNRHYDSSQGRFTQVDPLEMDATDLGDPQTLNLYTYCGNDPVNHIDPDGLFFKKLFNWIKKHWKIIVAIAVAVAVVLLVPGAASAVWGAVKSVGSAIWGGIKAAGSAVWSGIKGVGNFISKSFSSLFTNQKYPLLASLQDPVALPPGYEWVGSTLTKIGGSVVIDSVTVTAASPVLAVIGVGSFATISAVLLWAELANGPALGATSASSNAATNGNTSRLPTNNGNTSTNTNTNSSRSGPPRGNKWSCFAKAAVIEIATNSAVRYITGAGHGPSELIAGLRAKKDAANNTPVGFRTKHNKVTKCIKRF